MKIRTIVSIPALMILLNSCAVEPGGYGYSPGYHGSSYYGSTYYGGGYSSPYYHGGHNHSGHTVSRPFGKPWSSADDVRLNADHRTSPHYRDPHNGGISHNHDAAGHRVDSRGHHVDEVGNHIGNPGGGHSSHVPAHRSEAPHGNEAAAHSGHSAPAVREKVSSGGTGIKDQVSRSRR